MKRIFQLSMMCGFAALLFIASATNVDGQATRTWVSGVGDDVNPCSRTAPCKTFAGAISKTATNGEINCIDPGGFGAVTITKSITIDCSEVAASILATLGSNGVLINITNVADTRKTVRLRGISINGATTGNNGIRVLAANSVFVEDVIIDGFSAHGISVETSANNLKFVVSGATVSNNQGNGFNTFVTGGSASLSVNNSLFAVNNIGFNLSQAVNTTFQNSIINGNNTGVLVNAGTLGMTNCQVSGNGVGVQAGNGGTIRMFNNSVLGNTTGLAGSTLISLGSNVVRGNTANGSFTSNEATQ